MYPPFLTDMVRLPACRLLNIEKNQIGLLIFVKGIDHDLRIALPVYNVFIGKEAELAPCLLQRQVSGQPHAPFLPVQAEDLRSIVLISRRRLLKTLVHNDRTTLQMHAVR